MSSATNILAEIDPNALWQRRNLPIAQLTECSLQRHEGLLTSTGALTATTGKYTGRSPKDKYLVDDAYTHDQIDWGAINQPMSAEIFSNLRQRMIEKAQGQEFYLFDGYGGADPEYRLPIRIITQYAWHSLFAQQLFVRPTSTELSAHQPEFTIFVAPDFLADPERDGVHSEAVIALNLTEGLGLICGTQYAGEIKKSIFTILNYLLPQRGIFPMHCSANIGPRGDSALFFGLSGTGKTTLSTDAERLLIGDDEHGWSERGIFNFEGGCYAKCIHLSKAREPQIWDAIRFGTVLENIVVDPNTRIAQYDDSSLTENTRAAYPLDYIPNAVLPSLGGHPKTILFLTADASGVLPPIARLTKEQAIYHFLSGYTSKLAGTERGVTQPEPNFSACFGAPFWPLPPVHYAHMLGEKLDTYGATCYLVNTGWSGGAYGIGKRIDLDQTRAMVHAALRGDLAETETVTDPIFGLHIPVHIDGVPDTLLQPRRNWADPEEYERAAHALAARFVQNFRRFPSVSPEIKSAEPQP